MQKGILVKDIMEVVSMLIFQSHLAIERLKKLFDCNFANVQPHSGAQANGAVFLALLNLVIHI